MLHGSFRYLHERKRGLAPPQDSLVKHRKDPPFGAVRVPLRARTVRR